MSGELTLRQDGFYRVRVTDRRSEALGGVSDADYLSPVHSSEAAARLLRAVLGRVPDLRERRWVRAVAGGQKTIELLEVDGAPGR